MKVRATKPGFIHSRMQKTGDVFSIVPGLFSKAWMEKVDSKVEETFVPKQKPKPVTTGSGDVKLAAPWLEGDGKSDGKKKKDLDRREPIPSKRKSVKNGT